MLQSSKFTTFVISERIQNSLVKGVNENTQRNTNTYTCTYTPPHKHMDIANLKNMSKNQIKICIRGCKITINAGEYNYVE